MDIQGVPLNDSTVPIYPAKWKENLTDSSRQSKGINLREKELVSVDRGTVLCCWNNDGSNAKLICWIGISSRILHLADSFRWLRRIVIRLLNASVQCDYIASILEPGSRTSLRNIICGYYLQRISHITSKKSQKLMMLSKNVLISLVLYRYGSCRNASYPKNSQKVIALKVNGRWNNPLLKLMLHFAKHFAHAHASMIVRK